MTGPALGVSPRQLREHVARLDAVAGEIDAVRQASASTTPGSAAYGQLCMSVPVLIRLLQDPLVAAIGAAAQSLHDTSTTMSLIADDYADADAVVTATVGEAGDSS